MDHVDRIVAQWAAERPDIDTGPMAVIGRVSRVSSALSRGMQKTFHRFGLNSAKFDVLATLRRSGPPYSLSPNDLLSATMVASGTMTNRIDRLVDDGLVERVRNPDDSRSFLITLTEKGRTLIDLAVTEHVATQAALVSVLDDDERNELARLLSKLMSNLEKG